MLAAVSRVFVNCGTTSLSIVAEAAVAALLLLCDVHLDDVITATDGVDVAALTSAERWSDGSGVQPDAVEALAVVLATAAADIGRSGSDGGHCPPWFPTAVVRFVALCVDGVMFVRHVRLVMQGGGAGTDGASATRGACALAEDDNDDGDVDASTEAASHTALLACRLLLALVQQPRVAAVLTRDAASQRAMQALRTVLQRRDVTSDASDAAMLDDVELDAAQVLTLRSRTRRCVRWGSHCGAIVCRRSCCARWNLGNKQNADLHKSHAPALGTVRYRRERASSRWIPLHQAPRNGFCARYSSTTTATRHAVTHHRVC